MDDIAEFGRSVLRQEAEGVLRAAELLDDDFARAVRLILEAEGHVVVTGVGKPWLIGQKISATLASTGTPSFALHPSEAMHGDLGRLRSRDVVIAISNSGESEEVTRLLPVLKRIGCTCVALTGKPESALGRHADVVLNFGKVSEACPIGMAPSVSTTVMLALGDALALAVMKARNFTRQDYARFHPGGALGRSLMQCREVMQPLAQTPQVGLGASVKDALDAITQHKAGAVFITDAGRLKGVFTDGDLRRHFQQNDLPSRTIDSLMTSPCLSIEADRLAPEAVRIMQERRIGELPVVDKDGQLLGHIALKDLATMHFI